MVLTNTNDDIDVIGAVTLLFSFGLAECFGMSCAVFYLSRVLTKAIVVFFIELFN